MTLSGFFCGTKDQNALAYFADEGLYHLYVCEQCHTYIKAIDLRHTESEVLLRLERVRSVRFCYPQNIH